MVWDAANFLLESQRHTSFGSNHDFTSEDLSLTLYLTSTSNLLVHYWHRRSRGSSTLYLSKASRGAEMNYSSIECHYFTLIFARQKLRHYFLAHHLNLVTRSNLLKYLLSRPAMPGRSALWPLQLNEFDITVVTSRGCEVRPHLIS